MVSLPGSPWNAIIEAAKHQLPSLDSDSSLSDCEEEEPYIFQRNEPILIPDLAELLAEEPEGGDESGTWVPLEWSSTPELLLVPGELSTEPGSGQKEWMGDLAHQEGRGPGLSCQSYAQSSVLLVAEEDPTQLESNLESLSFNTKGSQIPPWNPQGGEAAISQEGELKANPLDADLTDSGKRRALRRERRKMIEKDVLQKMTLETQYPGQAAESGPRLEALSEKTQEGCPVLSLQQLEEWDLDYILQSLPAREDNQGDGTPRTAWWLADRCQGKDHKARHSQDRLLEKLTLLCATQSRTCGPARKVPINTSQDTEEQKAIHRCALAEPGFQAEPCQKPVEAWRQKTEPPTIFIDLRQTELQEPQEQQSSESSEHSSSDGDEAEDGGVQKGPAASSFHRLRDCTGKSQLLQQLRAFRKGMASSQLPASKSPGDQKAQATGDAAGLGTGRKKHVKLWAEEQSTQARFPGGLLGVPGDPLQQGSAKEVPVPALGQL